LNPGSVVCGNVKAGGASGLPSSVHSFCVKLRTLRPRMAAGELTVAASTVMTPIVAASATEGPGHGGKTSIVSVRLDELEAVSLRDAESVAMPAPPLPPRDGDGSVCESDGDGRVGDSTPPCERVGEGSDGVAVASLETDSVCDSDGDSVCVLRDGVGRVRVSEPPVSVGVTEFDVDGDSGSLVDSEVVSESESDAVSVAEREMVSEFSGVTESVCVSV
jgi:hypothetical protein